MPVLLIVPPELSCTLHVTVVFVVPVTIAAKDCVEPDSTVTKFGVTVTAMVGVGAGVGVGVGLGDELPPHPHTPITAAIISPIALG